ncbi:MAG: SGNH/GDSL hydrolase family protein [Acidobacteriaceae bacterium]
MNNPRHPVLIAVLSAIVFAQPLLGKAETRKWVGTWASAPLLDARGKNAEEALTATTLREVVHVSMGGDMVRVRFSNAFGKEPLKIEAAAIAQTQKGSSIASGSSKPLTFHGQPSVSIPPGALMVSDPVSFKLAALSDLTVSFYLPNPTGPITEHSFADATGYHASGNVVANETLDSPTSVTAWEYLNGVDVVASERAGAVVTLGDSITDGAKSTLDENRRWPDELARRLQADSKLRDLSVLNEGIGGNKILVDGAGVNALARFDRDVLAQSGAKYLLILEGINDIGGLHNKPDSVTAADLINGLNQMIIRAHAHGIAVIGCTLTPYGGAGYSTDAGEAVRKAVNDWIRTGGAFDGFVDFEAAVRDPQHPDTFLPSDDPGDHLHPNDAGYKAMGDAIELKLFTMKPKQP